MIGIKKISGGRFGNRLLHYLNMLQISKKLGVDCFCEHWEGHDWFEHCVYNNERAMPHGILIGWREILSDIHLLLPKNQTCTLDGAVIHNFFYDLTIEHPRNLVKIKKEYLPQFENSKKNIGVHIRGGDIISADGNNGREIHSIEFYKKALEEIINADEIGTIFVCTDDLGFSLFRDFVSHVEKEFPKINLRLGPSTQNPSLEHIYDLGLLSECDYLIASSSTYAISAGLLGREKKIIHSKEWLNKNIPGETYVSWGKYTSDYPEEYWKKYDKFWIRVSEGGNEFYKPWKNI